MNSEERSTPISLITGFLGSGKTTLVNALLRAPEMRDTVVLVNEFGDIGIDHLLVETLDDDVVLLNAGCLCCTMRDDVVASLTSLHERRRAAAIPDFRRVVIETTGLADPAPILHTLLGHEAVRAHYGVDAIVTTVDALHGERQLSRHDECLKQVAVADRLLITKTDLASEPDVESLRRRLATINAGAPIFDVVNGAIAPSHLTACDPVGRGRANIGLAAWLGVPRGEQRSRGDGSHDRGHAHDRIQHCSLEWDAPIEAYRFVGWIERLLATHGDKVLRVKGIVDMAGSEVPVVVHGVQHVFHPFARLARWPDADRRSRVVVIVRDLPIEPIVEAFRQAMRGQHVGPPGLVDAAAGR